MKNILLATVMVVAMGAPAVSGDHFFPTRPPGAATSNVTGTLVGFSHGEAIGYIRVQDDAGTIWVFYLGYPATIDGAVASCFNGPTASVPGRECINWPSGVLVGSTRVTATYWTAQLNGAAVLASDELRTPGYVPLSHKRKPR